MNFIEILNVYSQKSGRLNAYVKYTDGTHKVISYPKALMEQKLGRHLGKDEDVHHKDGDFHNNDLSNLELAKHGEHQREHAMKYYDKVADCDYCGKSFIWTAKQQSGYYRDLSRQIRYKTCSKRCAALIGQKNSPLYK